MTDLLALARSPRFRHTEEKMREALQRFVRVAWWGTTSRPVPIFSIPARPEEDADMILADAITELVEMRLRAERAEQQAARLRQALRQMLEREHAHAEGSHVENCGSVLDRSRAALAEGDVHSRAPSDPASNEEGARDPYQPHQDKARDA